MTQTTSYEMDALGSRIDRRFEGSEYKLQQLQDEVRRVREEMQKQARERQEAKVRRGSIVFYTLVALAGMLYLSLLVALVTKKLVESTIVTLPAIPSL